MNSIMQQFFMIPNFRKVYFVSSMNIYLVLFFFFKIV